MNKNSYDANATLRERVADLERQLAEKQKWIDLTKNHAPYEAAGATWEQRHQEDQRQLAEAQAVNEKCELTCDACDSLTKAVRENKRLREALESCKTRIDIYSQRDETMGRAVFDGGGVYEIIEQAMKGAK